jgi:hypothetical protein
MIKDLFLYYFIFSISIAAVVLLQHYSPKIIVGLGLNKKTVYDSPHKTYILFLVLAMLPLILIYGLRYGIGTDYFGYEHIYNVLSNSTIMEYVKYHSIDKGSYYVEPAYYILNVISPSYRAMQFLIAFIIFAGIAYILYDNRENINMPFALWIYLCTQFIFSMNGVRFSVALVFVLIAYNELVKGRNTNYIIWIIIGSTFHKMILLCLVIYFLKNYNSKIISKLVNVFLLIIILIFPIFNKYIFRILSRISFFDRYFNVTEYSYSESITSNYTWIIHIIPVLLPIVIFAGHKIKYNNVLKISFRIYLLEIPFRMLGLYNTFYTRLARLPQIIEVLLIPYIIGQVKNSSTRRALYIYFIVWYSFYFAYYAIVGDGGDSLPYVSCMWK